jgi:protein gp37
VGKTAIQWCDFTHNVVWGCSKVSPACDHCYAETWAKRTGWTNLWGPDAERRTFGAKYWAEPLKWNREAQAARRTARVFCSSMADVFDNHPTVSQEREKLWPLIEATPHLEWLLLTKRVGNVLKMIPTSWANMLPWNVRIGASIVTQAEADRDIPKLLAIEGRNFLSCEPLLEALDLTEYLSALDLVIVGGESGAHARPMKAEWAYSLRLQCQKAGVAYFFKQGSQANWHDFQNFDAFPPELRVREWPK